MAIDYSGTLTLKKSEKSGNVIIVNGFFCGSNSTFTPKQLRVIAAALVDAADRADAGEIGHIDIDYKASSQECAFSLVDD